ncbi:S8 family serine peptidase [Henriciella sp.]|uniref:S8 family serine peptidase n=1 Tax=Henriciella sp. TaxID=1968823 RepID=UPI00262995D5|nr:S8 family serine peptidase [Henriciella sp.]
MRDTTDRIGRHVEKSVEEELEDRVIGFDEAVDPLQILENGEVVESADVGNTLDQTLSLVNETEKTVLGITGLAGQLAVGREIELDTFEGWTVIRNEWVVVVPSSQAGEVEALDVDIVERSTLTSSNETLFIISLTAKSATAEAIEGELSSLGAEPYDRNHVFRVAAPQTDADEASPAFSAPETVSPARTKASRIGLIDTDVDETHPVFGDVVLHEADFVSLGRLRPQTHGTATASILAHQKTVEGAKVEREILAASAFFLAGDGTTGASSASIIRAIDWLQASGANVINISLTGPPNRALEAVIRNSMSNGTIFVAAVGNEGPASGPLYPAAYQGVIGVTAVDKDGQVYRWANRGRMVDVGAIGVDVSVARPGGGEQLDSGTSFAAPVVSAFLAGWTGGQQIHNGAGESMIRASTGAESPDARDDTLGYGILIPDTIDGN